MSALEKRVMRAARQRQLREARDAVVEAARGYYLDAHPDKLWALQDAVRALIIVEKARGTKGAESCPKSL